MKYISKHQEPRRFSVWKANQRRSRRLSWNRFRPPLKAEVHRSLLREQGYICCYCESRVQVNDSHIEHFRPRSRYPGLALDYENLHCSCLLDLKPGQPRHCGHEKRNWLMTNCLFRRCNRTAKHALRLLHVEKYMLVRATTWRRKPRSGSYHLTRQI